MKILIDGIEVDEEEYLDRVEIVYESDTGFCDEFLDLFAKLGVPILDEQGEMTPIEDLTESLSDAYFNYMDFVSIEFPDEYIN